MKSAVFRWTGPAANDGSGGIPGAGRHNYRVVANTLQWLLDEVLAETLALTRRMPPGLDRLWEGVVTRLDACRRRPAIAALAATLHGREEARQIERSSTNRLVQILEAECRQLGLAGANACILDALIEEARAAENEQRRLLPEYRNALRRHLWALHR